MAISDFSLPPSYNRPGDMMGLTLACLVIENGPSGMGPNVTRVLLWFLVSSDWVGDGNVVQAEPIRIFSGSFPTTTSLIISPLQTLS